MAILETRARRSLVWPDEAACAATAATLARHDEVRNAFLELHGPLGAGKTTFARHLLQALGVQGRVKSPTYALMESYESQQFGPDSDTEPLQIWHFDFYRFNDPQEWEDAGFREVFGACGLKLVEWPEQARGLLPQADLRIDIEPGAGDARSIVLTAHTPTGLALLMA